MNQFVQRIANYVANEVIIKGLANSKTFQRFAVRTNKQYEDLHKQGTEKLTKTFEELAKEQQQATGKVAADGTAANSGAAAQNALQPPQRPLRGIPGFFLAFAKEIRKDITGS